MTFFSEMRRIHDIQTRLRTGDIAASDRLDAPTLAYFCLLYTSDAADERSSVDLGGRRIIKKKFIKIIQNM